MKKIILNLAVTLDGFIEGPNGETDWCGIDSAGASDASGAEAHFNQFLADIDTIFYGRISYDRWGNYQPDSEASPFEKKLWSAVHGKTKYVFSHHHRADDKATYITHDIARRVQEIKNQAGKNIWLYGGGNLVTSMINLGLVDKYLLAVYPVVLGNGKPLFSDIKNRVNLKLNNVVSSPSGVMLLDYEKK